MASGGFDFFYLLSFSHSLFWSFLLYIEALDMISHSQAVCFIIRFRNIDLIWLGCGPEYCPIV